MHRIYILKKLAQEPRAYILQHPYCFEAYPLLAKASAQTRFPHSFATCSNKKSKVFMALLNLINAKSI